MQTNSLLLCCDWGTTNFRIQLLEINTGNIIASETSDNGIAKVFAEWKETKHDNNYRIAFYYAVIEDHIRKIEKKINLSLQQIPVVLSGMASSRIGMMELNYKPLPFSTDGSDIIVEKLEKDDIIFREVYLISGACTTDDVMRGEETQLIGCFDENSSSDGYYIFPGTHSKHVEVERDKAISIQTFLTGELFELLSQKSILASSIEKNNDFNSVHVEAFKKGIYKSLEDKFLHACFSVRTNEIFNKLSKKENYHFLSGLLIGTELKELNDKSEAVFIVGNAVLQNIYKIALQQISSHISILCLNAEEAILKGQLKIYNNRLHIHK